MKVPEEKRGEDSELLELIERKGPLRGKDLCELVSIDRTLLWRVARTSPKLFCRSIARHYLRLDKNVKGYARLSPSIWREFYSYTVIGLESKRLEVEEKAMELKREIEAISREKEALIRNICEGIHAQLSYNYPEARHGILFLIAGDVVYAMAHRDPRPEPSTGKLVVGSDIDLVVLVRDELNNGLVKLLEDMVFKEKQRLLLNPYHKEELDFVVKRLSLLKAQMAMVDFRQMVAMKVLWESRPIAGERSFYEEIMALPEMERVSSVFQGMEATAKEQRRQVEEAILNGTYQEEFSAIFYPAEESEEF